MSVPPIKTGAWVKLQETGEILRCDLYEYRDIVLIARCNPRSTIWHMPDDEPLWATMHTFDNDWDDKSARVHVSTDYTIHYVQQHIQGEWRNVAIT